MDTAGMNESTRQQYTQQAAYLHALGYSRDSIKQQLFETERVSLLSRGLANMSAAMQDGVLLALARQVDQFVDEYFGIGVGTVVN